MFNEILPVFIATVGGEKVLLCCFERSPVPKTSDALSRYPLLWLCNSVACVRWGECSYNPSEYRRYDDKITLVVVHPSSCKHWPYLFSFQKIATGVFALKCVSGDCRSLKTSSVDASMFWGPKMRWFCLARGHRQPNEHRIWEAWYLACPLSWLLYPTRFP